MGTIPVSLQVYKEYSMHQKIVLIGAGSVNFGLPMLGDIFKSEVLKGSEIILNDIDLEALGKVEREAKRYIQENGLPFTVTASADRRKALQGADVCISSIEVGNRFDLWEKDWKVPLQYGIPQVYGENGGPGGLFHALRIIPPILDICGDVMEVSPDALMINLSNPMIRISHAVHTKYPNLKYIGMCHEVTSLVDHLPLILDTPLSNLKIRAGGFNHFSVLVNATYLDSGEDAYPDIREKAPAYFETAPANFGYIGERGLFQEILAKFDVLPITTDSHMGEYIQWAHDVVDHEGILKFFYTYKQNLSSARKHPVEQLTEGMGKSDRWRIVPIIEGILTDSHQEELAVNIPNKGYIPYLPTNQAVEVPAIVDKDGVHGIRLDNYPKAFAGLLMNQVAVNDLTTEAVLTRSKAVALQAMLVDPVVNNLHAAEQLLDTIRDLEQPYLDYLK